MKRYAKWTALLLAGVLLLLSAACGGKQEEENRMNDAANAAGLSAEEDMNAMAPTAVTTTARTAAPVTAPTAASAAAPPAAPTTAPAKTSTTATNPPTKTRPDITMREEITQNGLVLRVSTSYQHLFAGEPFTLTATITNTNKYDIIYGAGSGTPGMHQEILVRITGKDGTLFTDADTYDKIMTMDYRFATLKAGETFTEEIRFLPGTPRGTAAGALQDMQWFPAGEYQGTAVFTWYAGTAPDFGAAKELRLEFPAVLI